MNDGLISVLGNELQFHYFASAPNNPYLACNVGELTCSNLDLSARLKPYSSYYGNFYGVGYRLDSQTSSFQSPGGYYAQLNQYDSPNRLSLWYGNDVRDRNRPWLLYDNIADPYQLMNLCGRRETSRRQRQFDEELTRRLAAIGDEFLPGEDYLRRWGYELDPVTKDIPIKR